MKRIERKLFRWNDELAALRKEHQQASEELVYHQHLDDDAQRDAAGGSPQDRADARETAADVTRIQAHLADLETQIASIESKRGSLIDKLGD